jgi:cytochrome c peroxidase
MRARPSLFAHPARYVAVVFGAVAVAAVLSSLVTLRRSTAAQSADRLAEPRAVTTTPGSTPASAAAAERRARLAAVGERVFFDASLSNPPGTSCASCHDPKRAFAGNNGSTNGVAQGSRTGHFARRNTPSLLYLKLIHRFHWHWEEDVDLPDAAGGFFWDGRADSLATLVLQPLLNGDEMNGGDLARVADKLRAAPYADELRAAAGADSLASPESAGAALGQALEAFLLGDAMAPFSSRYDDYIRGIGALTPLELRGLALFRDPQKGNCAACHKFNPSSPTPTRSPFSDYGYEAVGVPRNRAIPINSDGNVFDLGLCERRDSHADEDRLCGAFRTPSLRNVAVRERFMHNGAFARLRDVVAFYATRSTNPERWYPRGERYDDLPAKYRGNVNELRPPYDRGPGETPRLDDAEIDAIVAFLGTLTDAAYLKNTDYVAPKPVVSVPLATPKHDHAPANRRRDKRTLANDPQSDPTP